MATAAQVTQAYFDLLGRPPDPAGLAYYTTGEGAARGIDQIRADFQYATDIGAESPALVNQSDVNQFNTLVASGDYEQAAQFAAAKGVDPAITADYINQNAANLNLDADFRMNAGDVSSLTRDDVSSAYENILGRAPDQEGLDFYTDPANLSTGAGLTGLPALQALLADSPEGRARDLLNRTYQTTLNRDPDQKAYDFYLPQIISGDLNADNLVSAVTGGAKAGSDQQAAINFALQKNLGEFDRLVAAGDFTGAKGILDQSINQYYLDPNASYANIAEYLNTDPKFAGIRKANKDALFTPENVRSFGKETQGTTPFSFTDQLNALFQTNLGRLPTEREASIYFKDFGGIFSPELESAFLSRSTEEMGNRQKGITEAADAAAKAAETAAANAEGRPGSDQILGIPTLARQTPSALTFAPLRRGLAQLSPAMSMTGLTSGRPAFGGSGVTPARDSVSQAYIDILGRLPDAAGLAYYTTGEGAAKGIDQIRKDFQYAVDTGAEAGPYRGLPADFTLQTGAYGAAAPTFLNRPVVTPGSIAGAPFPSGSNIANANQPGSLGGDGSGITAGDPNSPGFGLADALGTIAGYVGDAFGGEQDGAPVGDASPGTPGTGPGSASDPGSDGASPSFNIGGLTKMAEGGGPPKMSKLSAAEAGSTFDISKYIDDQGRLVGGFSRPVYDENQVITGYDYRPYERDVVFGEELREKEERERMRNMAEGGLASVAQNLAERGRYGDSTLVHMAPEEIAGLRALARAQGTDMTINPRTGLPEAFSLKKLFKAASFILPFVPIPGLFGMSSLLTKSIMSGIAAGASAKGGFDFKQALGGGLSAYALGSLGEKMSGATTPGGTPTTPPTTVSPEMGGVNPIAPSVETGLSPYADISKMPITDTAPIPQGPTFTGSVNLPSGPITPTTPVDAMLSGTPTAPVASSSIITPKGEGFGPAPLTKGTDIALAGLGGLSLQESAKEQRSYEIEAAALKREEEERRRRFEDLAYRTLGRVNVKSGGQINLANGGMTYMEAGGTTGPTGVPRDVTGTGDGMSDSVPATIEGVQEARLADGEFVIPADVVADIGNGSSDAGSKKLYDMMDRIRKARHGTTKQPPEIRAERLMPA
jgi:hypothetical protein